MKKNILWAACSFVVMLAIALSGFQTRTNFSGTWVIDAVEGPEGAPARPGAGGAGGFGGGRRNGGPVARLEKGQRIRITQTAEQIAMTATGDGEEWVNTYLLDGRESTNASRRGTVKSRTKWEGAALVTESTRQIDGPMGDMTVKTREVRSLSDDGRTMTVRTTIDTPRGQRTATVTFLKAEQ